MPRNWTRVAALAMAGAIMIAVSARAGDPTASLKQGNPQIKSAGPLGFGPDGILFVGDTQGSALFAIDTGDRTAAGQKHAGEGQRPGRQGRRDARHRAQAGHDQRPGRQPDLGQRVSLGLPRPGPRCDPRPHAPGGRRQARRGRARQRPVRPGRDPQPARRRPPRSAGESLRNESITDIAYVDGRVFIAGLSNEEFSSRLIAIPFPFSEGFDGAAIEIYHGAHGRFETKSPVRTFVPYKIGNDPYLLAAYTCTPLVKVPVGELKAGAHVKGTTIAELGNRNRPLDMITYQKDGKDYLLLANSSRGVMKIPTEGAGARRGHHRTGPGDQGNRLRHDRQPQGRRPDGQARRRPRRDPDPGLGRGAEPGDRGTAVIGALHQVEAGSHR